MYCFVQNFSKQQMEVKKKKKKTHWKISGFMLVLAPKEEMGKNNGSNALFLCIKYCFYLNIHFVVEWSFAWFEGVGKFKDVYSADFRSFLCWLYLSPGMEGATCDFCWYTVTFHSCGYFPFSKRGLRQMFFRNPWKKLSSWWCKGHKAENWL